MLKNALKLLLSIIQLDTKILQLLLSLIQRTYFPAGTIYELYATVGSKAFLPCISSRVPSDLEGLFRRNVKGYSKTTRLTENISGYKPYIMNGNNAAEAALKSGALFNESRKSKSVASYKVNGSRHRRQIMTNLRNFLDTDTISRSISFRGNTFDGVSPGQYYRRPEQFHITNNTRRIGEAKRRTNCFNVRTVRSSHKNWMSRNLVAPKSDGRTYRVSRSAGKSEDKPVLVLWYKDALGTPIYRYSFYLK